VQYVCETVPDPTPAPEPPAPTPTPGPQPTQVPAPRPNTMRVQLQEGPNNLWSKAAENTAEQGVTVRQVQALLAELFYAAESGNVSGYFPFKDLERPLWNAIIDLSLRLERYPPGGTVEGDKWEGCGGFCPNIRGFTIESISRTPMAIICVELSDFVLD
jgi:hypothetical protein